MMVQYRPVDCDSKKPLKFDPGYISNVIYEVSLFQSVAADRWQLYSCVPAQV